MDNSNVLYEKVVNLGNNVSFKVVIRRAISGGLVADVTVANTRLNVSFDGQFESEPGVKAKDLIQTAFDGMVEERRTARGDIDSQTFNSYLDSQLAARNRGNKNAPNVDYLSGVNCITMSNTSSTPSAFARMAKIGMNQKGVNRMIDKEVYK